MNRFKLKTTQQTTPASPQTAPRQPSRLPWRRPWGRACCASGVRTIGGRLCPVTGHAGGWCRATSVSVCLTSASAVLLRPQEGWHRWNRRSGSGCGRRRARGIACACCILMIIYYH
jgi:hypothetical protein